ncbi:hypothetical protein D9M72_585990 [compost metagenome]
MHVDAVGAAIDMRGADLDEFDDGRVQARGNGDGGAHPVFHQLGGGSEKVDLGSHGSVSFRWFRYHDETGLAGVTSPRNFF